MGKWWLFRVLHAPSSSACTWTRREKAHDVENETLALNASDGSLSPSPPAGFAALTGTTSSHIIRFLLIRHYHFIVIIYIRIVSKVL